MLFGEPSMSSLIRVRPTKIELIKLKRRRDLARKVHHILRERLTILVNEFLTRIRSAYRIRREVNDKIIDVYNRAVFLSGLYGEQIYRYFEGIATEGSGVIIGYENIMGVRSYTAMYKKGVFRPVLPELEDFRRDAERLIERIIELGRIEQSIHALGVEITKTKRRVNALEYIFIPKLEATIKYLRMKFEEREREERARLKRVKGMLEARRRGGGG